MDKGAALERKEATANQDSRTVEGFGEEWSNFDQSSLDEGELAQLFERYFSIFPWDDLAEGAEGFDAGCGSGRWAKMVAPRVGKLNCIDASKKALSVAQNNLSCVQNVEFHNASIGEMPLADASQDFGYSLGVLHHMPDTLAGMKSCVSKLKPGAPFLVYLYYAFDNRPPWFRLVWQASDVLRKIISRLPRALRIGVCNLIAATVYWPLAMFSVLVARLGGNIENIPLSAYAETSFYTMRTDALDRFGTHLEQRFTKAEMREMMKSAGLEEIIFSENLPYWCAIGRRGADS